MTFGVFSSHWERVRACGVVVEGGREEGRWLEAWGRGGEGRGGGGEGEEIINSVM